MEVKLNIPTKLSEITLKQYKKFLVVHQENSDVNFIQAKMMEIFCGVSHKFAALMKYSDVEEITGNINKLFLAKPQLITTFKIKGKEYGFVPNLDDMTLGEYIDLDSFTGEYKNIEVAMNVLYRPIEAKLNGKYSIKKYDPETKNEMLEMPMDAVISSLFFFLNLGIELSQITLNSLAKPQITQLEEYKHFQQNMDGINQWQHSLNSILQDLNISLN